MQVEGYSLDAQKDKLRKYAEYQEMSIVGEYFDEGKSGKSVEGRWNGGFAPYGYQLVNGELIIAEDEAEIIRIIYDKFVNTTMGMAAIAAFLNNSGYKKKLRKNNTIEGFSTSFVKGVLDNPIYCGKLAFGRRKNGFLCEVFHPAVRYEKGYWKEFLTEINKLLQNDETGISERTILHLSAIQVQIHGRTCSFRAECLRP